MASKLSISKERTAELVKEFGKGEGDSGSPEVQVAIITVKRAYDDLEQAGMIETRQGKGCFVCSLDVQTVQEQAGAQLIEEFQATLDKGLKLGLTLPQIQTLFDQAQKTVIQEKREKS